MNMQKNRQLLALLVTLALVIAPLVTLGIYIYGEHQKAQALLEKLEPRHARLLGLSSQESDIAALLEQVQKAGQPRRSSSRECGPAAYPRNFQCCRFANQQQSGAAIQNGKRV